MIDDYMELHFEISNNCILKCKHCSSSKKDFNLAYSIDEMLTFISNFNEPTNVFFTGGEPLLNENLGEIIQQTSSFSNVHNIGLFTTGLYFSENEIIPISIVNSQKLCSLGLNQVYVSLYDFENDAHDFLTNTVGAFDKTIEAVYNMKIVDIDVKLNVVVYKRNINKLSGILKFAKDIGISEVRFLKLVEHGNALNNLESIAVDSTVFEKEITNILPLSTDNCRITVSSLPQIIPCRPNINAKKCQAGCNLLYIDYSGNAYPCACVKNNTKYLLGNIRNAYDVLAKKNALYIEENSNCLSGGQK